MTTNFIDENTINESSKTILVIEDEADTRNLFLVVLEANGYDAIVAENGVIGIQQAQKHLPDLIVCDIMMPDMDGYSVLDTLRQDPLTAIIPFIFLTGSQDKASQRKGMELGADDYLTKPSTIEDILKAIATRLEKQARLRYWYAAKSHELSQTLAVESEFIFPSIPHLKEVFDYIEAHYHQGITLSDVASAVGYSSAYLTSRVSRETGDTVNGWILKRRMAAARPLLKNTNKSIEQIATELGYQNACHFSRQFRQYHGLPPKAWRKQQQSLQSGRSLKPQLNQTYPQTEKCLIASRG
ncbi:two-component response regulator [Nostoc sp. NIES-3756]|jgi:YesN/AraC family two-component response regulator|uniref:response regulator transcription factor n=1 Tax=Nostoc sp. NIES-3756 TaxID=1751286 RepID=UPI0007229F34|nr:response regulator [Nostoc sp. NIES-3756]BAT54215.1 two-component response regulator [Nostoc sp. NIES-3756]